MTLSRSVRYFFRRRFYIYLFCGIFMCTFWLSGERTHHNLEHFKRSRILSDYFDFIVKPVIEPQMKCNRTRIVVLVASAVGRYAYREAIRSSWGKDYPTYFILGVENDDSYKQIVKAESEKYGDLVVGDFIDTYDNLTLKSVFMLGWASQSCEAEYYVKADDDTFVNHFMLRYVIGELHNFVIIGHPNRNITPIRDKYNKWYLPQWLLPEEFVTESVNGIAYVIHGNYIAHIYNACFFVPLINIEDIYIAHLVIHKYLKLNLHYDARINTRKPLTALLGDYCGYWALAIAHSVSPNEMVKIWTHMKEINNLYLKGIKPCEFYFNYLNYEFMLYYR